MGSNSVENKDEIEEIRSLKVNLQQNWKYLRLETKLKNTLKSGSVSETFHGWNWFNS